MPTPAFADDRTHDVHRSPLGNRASADYGHAPDHHPGGQLRVSNQQTSVIITLVNDDCRPPM
jgi:hypothetical protein